MVFDPEFEIIGFIEKNHGIEGHVKISLNSISKKLEMEFLFLDYLNSIVPFKIINYNSINGLVLFKDINTPEKAQELVGANIYIIKKGAKTKTPQDLIGYFVVGDNLKLPIVGFEAIPNNPLLQISYKNQLLYLPFNESLIFKIDHTEKLVYDQLPNGILEL